jgi:hypothetical protein
LVICLFNIHQQTALAAIEGNSNLKWNGDFKYRFQTVTEADKDPRTQQRLQAKLGLETKLQDDLNLYFQLMTATSPTGSSQTLGDAESNGMPRRSFGLNLAYFNYKLDENYAVQGGKMPIPFKHVGKHQLLLDKDISPEGLSFKSEWTLPSDFKLGMNVGHFQIKEQYDSINNVDLTDNQLNGLQAQLDYLYEKMTFSLNLGSYSFVNFRDNPPGITGNAGKSNTESHNNTLDLSGNFPANFDVKEVGLEAKIPLSSKMGTLSFAISGLKNEDVDQLNQAQFFGVNYQVGFWSLGYQNIKIEKDAVVGAYMDSDFNNANTSTKGNIVSLGYKINKNSQFTWTQYASLGQIDTVASRLYDRGHFDYSLNF